MLTDTGAVTELSRRLMERISHLKGVIGKLREETRQLKVGKDSKVQDELFLELLKIQKEKDHVEKVVK